MKQLRHYLQQAETSAAGPVPGDVFAINIREECLLETSVHQVVRNGVILEADERLMQLLAQYDMLGETIRRYGPAASSRGQGFTVQEDSMEQKDRELRDYDNMTAHQFLATHGIKKSDWGMQNRDIMAGRQIDFTGTSGFDYASETDQNFQRMLELAGMTQSVAEGPAVDAYMAGKSPAIAHFADQLDKIRANEEDAQETAPLQPNPNAARTDPLAAKAADLAPVGTMKDPGTAATIDEGVMKDIATELGEIADADDTDALYDLMTARTPAGEMVREMYGEVAQDFRLAPDDDQDIILDRLMDRIVDEFSGQLDEAEYQGRKVALGKPMQGDVKKFKVYVKDPKTGNVKKVNFGHGGTSAKRAGEKTLSIKKNDPARRKSFRARHNCDNPGPRTKARYWSCSKW